MLAVGSRGSHLPFERFCYLSSWVTCHPPHKHGAGGEAGLDAGHPSKQQVVLGYSVTSSKEVNTDVTFHIKFSRDNISAIGQLSMC